MKKNARDALIAGKRWLRCLVQEHMHETAWAAGLLALIALTHYGYDPLAITLFGDSGGRAARALAYVLRGHEGFWLFLAVGVLARSRLLWPVCAFGMVEEAETSICRLVYPLTEPPPYDIFSGLCGYKAYTAGIAAAAVLALIITRRKR